MMNDEKPTPAQKEVLKTFDMYRCFSRIDVILALAFIVIAVLGLVWVFLTGNKTA
ncbi:MAG: hypothetical protein ACT4OY_04400 [Alphaproteobacteria bacterium]